MSVETKSTDLSSLKPGERALIIGFRPEESADVAGQRVLSRLWQMGLVEGAWVELLREAPIAKDPVVVRIRGALVALRKSEARLVLVGESA